MNSETTIALPVDEQMAIDERNKRRQSSETKDSKPAPKEGDLPELKPVYLPQMLGQGCGGPHSVTVCIDGNDTDLRLAPFTLGTQPTARACFDKLSSMASVVCLAYSRQKEDGLLDPDVLIELMKQTIPEEAAQGLDAKTASTIVGQVGVNLDDSEVSAIVDVITLALSRYCTGLKRESIQDSIDIVQGFQIIGKILRINSGLSDRFFG